MSECMPPACFSGGDSDNGSDAGAPGVGGYGLGAL